jgi:MFS family permease
MPQAAHALVRRYYTYAGIYTLAASLVWGINTLFLLDAGLSISEAFIANAAFSVGTVLFEIPTGVVADTVGRRASFLLSIAVLAASTLAYVGLAEIGGGVIAFSAASVLLGLGYTFYSGAMEAWLVDGLHGLGFDGGMDRIFANGQIIGGIAMLVGTVGGGLLGQIDLSIPFIVRSVLLVALFALAFYGMHDIGFEARTVTLRSLPAEANAVARAGIRFGWKGRPLRWVMVAGAIQNGFFFWAWYAWQPYFLELLARDAVWVAGVVAALLSLAMIIGNATVRVVTRFGGRRTTILIWTGIAFSLASIAVGFAASFLFALAALLVGAVAMGLQMPVRQAFIHGMVPSAQRATVVSFDSMVAGIGAVGGQAGLGVVADRRSYSAGYVLGGAITLVAVPIVWMVRRMRAPADAFEEPAGPQSSACAGLNAPTETAAPAQTSA